MAKLVSLFVARFATMLGVGVLLVIIPVYITRLGGSALVLGIAVSAVSFVSALLQPVMGRLVDAVNKRNLLTLAIFGFAFSLFLLAITANIKQIMLVQVLQGFTGAIIFPTTLAIVVELAPSDRLGTAMGFHGASVGAGLALGPLLAGVLVDRVSLGAPLYLSAVLSVLSAILVLISFRS